MRSAERLALLAAIWLLAHPFAWSGALLRRAHARLKQLDQLREQRP